MSLASVAFEFDSRLHELKHLRLQGVVSGVVASTFDSLLVRFGICGFVSRFNFILVCSMHVSRSRKVH